MASSWIYLLFVTLVTFCSLFYPPVILLVPGFDFMRCLIGIINFNKFEVMKNNGKNFEVKNREIKHRSELMKKVGNLGER